MKLRRLLTPALLGVAMVLVGLLAAGCGADDDATAELPSEAYAEILSGLEKAALADGTYGAAKKALDLSVPEREVIRAFCETAWQLEINTETDRLNKDAYYEARIRNLAEYDFEESEKPSEAVGVAMGELKKDLDLVAIDPELNHRYKKACYQ